MRFLLAAAALVLAMTCNVIGQTPSPATSGKARVLSTVPRKSVTVTEFYRQDVHDKSGQKIGQIVDVLIDPEGKTSFVIQVGGFLGTGEHNIVVPISSVQATKKDDKSYLVLDITKDALRSAPTFRYAARTWVRDEIPVTKNPAIINRSTDEGGELGHIFWGPVSKHSSKPLSEPLSKPLPPRVRAVRALIEPGDVPPRDLAGYGLVAFTTLPAPHDVERYKLICEAYKATLMSQDELPSNTPLSEQMITFWPVTDKSAPEAQRTDCSYLLSNYPLRVGLDAIQDADKHREALASRRGPFLIAWVPSDSRFKPDAVVLLMDLSPFEGQRSFIEIFQDWRQKITDNPELWRRGGFDIEATRRIIRDIFDRYGEGLMRLIKS